MAIIIEGKTPCQICGRVIEAGQKSVGLPSFVWNDLDPLMPFNDAAFHEQCFREHPSAERVASRVREMRERTGPGKRFCVVCGQKITNPDDYFVLGHLVDSEDHPLHRYNYTQAHISCLPAWEDRPRLHELLQELKRSGSWRGRMLDDVLAQLEKVS